MAKLKKNKKTYKELIKEIELLNSIVVYYRDYLERMGLLIENYIEMNEDTEKLVKYIEEKGQKLENKWNEKT
jgi:DNA-binding MarR family transcriptional regulator